MLFTSTVNAILASVKSGLDAVTVPSNFLNDPSTNEMPICLTEKLTNECIGSIFQLVCANEEMLIEAATKNKNNFFMSCFSYKGMLTAEAVVLMYDKKKLNHL
ncbi:hypothetical protein GCM10011413_25140 [Pedobacter psychrotolerans]|uniref:Uncharacterized protein n=1 Tax=Pedobacter psychrotolerans TaxID=1843235 RepID=A0ABQ1ST37_9SPHI|nr:hypothetical protein GCM10011413_25140 [Pedobacter psychrotolerans]